MDVYEFAKSLIKDAGDFIETRRLEGFEVLRKTGPHDLVTPVDKETESFIYNRIKAQFPEHKIVGEETYGKEVTELSGYTWIVDPIDGTVNFINQNDNFAISVGIYKDNEPFCGFVYDVSNKVLYHAKAGEGAYRDTKRLDEVKYQSLENTIVGLSHKWLLKEEVKEEFTELVVKARSVRNRGSAALDFTYVAEGKYGAAVFYKLFPWDFAGGRIIANELGIKVVTLTNEEVPVLESSSIVAGHKDLVDEILEIFNRDTFKKQHDKLYKK